MSFKVIFKYNSKFPYASFSVLLEMYGGFGQSSERCCEQFVCT